MTAHSIADIFQNEALFCALLGWLMAQTLKFLLYGALEGKLDFRRFVGSGGMPSSHSAMVVALTMMVGFMRGFETVEFAVCAVLAMIVMYDAAGVRRATGNQTVVINQILRDVLINGKPITDEELKELIGHTPLEVLGGAILGILVALGYWALWIP
ncbi:MAG: divergent PAP2 family protein [Candidatus Limiplasma sp.]|nr:divergent PAP2 family protein [Candidatus Limiplasma sp.]